MRQTLVGTYARATRDWYRGPIADIGMHADLVGFLISVAAPLASPVAPHLTTPDVHSARSVADSNAAGGSPQNSRGRILARAGQDSARRRADAFQDARKGLGRPAAVRPPRSPARSASTALFWRLELPRRPAKPTARCVHHGLIKDKHVMLFVQLFKVRSQAEPSLLLTCAFLKKISMRAHIGTYCGVWSRGDVQPQAAVRKDGRSARGGTSLDSWSAC